jgi:amino acid transporter
MVMVVVLARRVLRRMVVLVGAFVTVLAVVVLVLRGVLILAVVMLVLAGVAVFAVVMLVLGGVAVFGGGRFPGRRGAGGGTTAGAETQGEGEKPRTDVSRSDHGARVGPTAGVA